MTIMRKSKHLNPQSRAVQLMEDEETSKNTKIVEVAIDTHLKSDASMKMLSEYEIIDSISVRYLLIIVRWGTR